MRKTFSLQYMTNRSASSHAVCSAGCQGIEEEKIILTNAVGSSQPTADFFLGLPGYEQENT